MYFKTSLIKRNEKAEENTLQRMKIESALVQRKTKILIKFSCVLYHSFSTNSNGK